MDTKCGANFVIQNHAGMELLVGGYPQYDATISMIEPRAAWEGINYTQSKLPADKIWLEADSATVIDWLHPLLMDA